VKTKENKWEKWTEDEIEILSDRERRLDEIYSLLPHRTPIAIQNKATKLKFKRIGPALYRNSANYLGFIIKYKLAQSNVKEVKLEY